MQASEVNRTRWPLRIVTVLIVVLAATWWWRSSDDAVVSAPIPVAAAPAPVLAPTPAPVIAPKPVDTTPSASAFKLVGTVVAADRNDSFALVRRTADSQVMQWRTGDRVEGLTVSAIESDSVVLAGAAQAIVIEADRTAPASPAPSRAANPRPASDEEPAWAGDPAPFGH